MAKSNPLKYFNDQKAKRVAQVVKAQEGHIVKTMSPGEKAEARRDSLYNAHKAKTKAMMDSMMQEVKKVSAPTGKDTVRVGSVRITAAPNVAKKKTGGSTKKKC